MKDKNNFTLNIEEIIKSFTLFSPELTGVYRNKEYTLYTLKALSILDEISEDMINDMRIDVEEVRNIPTKDRGVRFDVLVHFPKYKINIEIQKLRNRDEINRAAFYVSKLATEIRKGTKRIPQRKIITVWICDFNPFKHIGKNLPYYTFEASYKKVDGIEGSDEGFPLGEGFKYIFINGRYDWEKLEQKRPLSELEKNIRTYIHDMNQVNPDNVICQITKDMLYSYKEGDMYNKFEMNFKKQHKDYVKSIREQGISEGISNGINIGKIATAKAMLKKNFDIDTIAEITGLDKDKILNLEIE